MHVWAKASGACMRALRSQRGFVQAIAVVPRAARPGRATPSGPAGSTVACGATNGKLRIWDHHRGKLLKSVDAHGLAVTAVAHAAAPGSAAGVLVTGGADAAVKVWDARTGAPKRTLATHAAAVVDLVVVDADTDRPRVFSAAKDGSLRLSHL